MKGLYITINGFQYWVLILDNGKKQVLIRRQDSGTMLFMNYNENTTMTELTNYIKDNEKYLAKIF